MAQGRAYEKGLHAKIKNIVGPHITVHDQKGGHAPDVELSRTANPTSIIGLEVKNKSTDTMGGTSLRFQNKELSDTPVKPVDAFDMVFPEIKNRITDPILNYIPRANELILAFNNENTECNYEDISGFPAKIPVAVRIQLRREGLQKRIQSFYQFDMDPWKSFYRSKGNSYIQIGDKGLFHLGENPWNLPVPELKGEISFEVRLYAAGTHGRPYAGVEIALKFKRLKCDVSPYNLNREEDIVALFNGDQA
jgi:hypothetical protein